ncbi:MAG: S1C family serine protease [Candidatus Binatia bacterium]
MVLDASGDTISQGSGFIVRPDGVIVTNWHVLQGASAAIVILSTRERFDRVSLVDGDSVADIAILRIPGFGLPALATRSSVPSVGERVVVVGSPLGLTKTVTDGIVSASRIILGREVVQVTAPISPGSSGGPVLDASGRVFAISTFYLEGGQQLNFAVPVRYALGLLQASTADRPLARVFGHSNTQARLGETATAAAPSRAVSPAASMAGTFLMDQSWTGTGPLNGRRDRGLLIAGSDEIGLLMLAALVDDSAVGLRGVYGMTTFRTDASGQVVLDVGGLTYDGYQTNDGFYATATTISKSGAQYSVVAVASRHAIPLSNPIGLYRLVTRTFYTLTSGY